MFDIAWTELLLVAIVAILVVGPKELPGMLRTIGKAVGSMRRLAGDFQKTFNDAISEAEKQAGIDEMRKQADAAQNFDPLGDIKKSISEEKKSFESTAADLNRGLNLDDLPETRHAMPDSYHQQKDGETKKEEPAPTKAVPFNPTVEPAPAEKAAAAPQSKSEES
ncbi:Sec-independent protein translocase protein TatB [Pseudovibrio flavus]|uniref:Sec-independent protein translocase protein TatB n=1 Tax=Pseudovibrio flavus TaxID=2529854 RepID=UPI00211C4B94|nr:Sec-independent protein translocase protein TatB [Pseudovibrio flavus]